MSCILTQRLVVFPQGFPDTVANVVVRDRERTYLVRDLPVNQLATFLFAVTSVLLSISRLGGTASDSAHMAASLRALTAIVTISRLLAKHL